MVSVHPSLNQAGSMWVMEFQLLLFNLLSKGVG
jgi:hypothetical protein